MNSNKRVLMIVGAVVLLVLLVFGLTVLVGGDDDDAADSGATATATAGSGSTAGAAVDPDAQTRPVTITGEALTPHEPGMDDPDIGAAAPVAEGQNYAGEALTIGGASDGPTLVVFLAHWCSHCNAEVPRLVQLERDGAIPDDLQVVGVGTAVDPTLPNYPPSEWFEAMDWPWPAMADDEQLSAFGAYGGTSFPYLVMLDADGNVIARQSGESDTAELQEWITTNAA